MHTNLIAMPFSVAYFDPVRLEILAGLVVLAFLLGLIVASSKGDRPPALSCGIEAAVLALAGGLLAPLVVLLLFVLLGATPGVLHVLSWAFLLWLGPIDLIVRLATGSWLVTLPVLLFAATLTGALTGMLNGIWRIHDWQGGGWAGFPLDVTWGLAGNVNGLLLHLVNQFIATSHVYEPRHEAHRYLGGFGLKNGFRFTQGCVMSNTEVADVPGSDLFTHERWHVWQNRIFGPFFTLSYVGWMIVWLVPAAVAGLATGAGPGKAVQAWCYSSNPWEVWAYSSTGDEYRGTNDKKLLWPPVAVIAAALPVYALFLFVGYVAVMG